MSAAPPPPPQYIQFSPSATNGALHLSRRCAVPRPSRCHPDPAFFLFGHSGGAPTMSFYQAVAENGVSFCQNPSKLVKCSNALAGLPPADGIVLMDAHPGNGVNALRS